MSAKDALDARRRAEARLDLHERGFDTTKAVAWALIAIAAELAEIRKVLEAK